MPKENDLEVRQEPFWTNIEQQLTGSRFLIVLCSPQSAGSVYVDREILHFLGSRLDAEKCIIPVIISGKPNSGDPATECFPPALRSLGERVAQRNLPTLIDASEEEMFLQTVAYMLQVSYVAINNRYQKQRRKQLRRWVIGAVGLSILLASLATFALIQRDIALEQKKEADDD